MPLVSDSSKTSNTWNEFHQDGQAQGLEDVELRDFSDDMDLNALGALLGGDSFSASAPADPSPEPQRKPSKQKKKGRERGNSNSFFGGIAAKFRGANNKKKKTDDLPPESEDISGFNFNYKPYTDNDMADDSARDGGLTDSPFAQSSPFEEQSPFTQSSPFEEQSPFAQSSPFEEQSPFAQSSPFEEQSPFAQSSPFEEQSPFAQGSVNGYEPLTDDSLESALPERDQKDAKKSGLKERFAAIAAKFGSRKKEAVPSVKADDEPNDPNYVSDTVRLVDMDEPAPPPPQKQSPPFGGTLEGNPPQQPPFGGTLEGNPPQQPPFGGTLEGNSPQQPPFGGTLEGNPPQQLPFGGTLEGTSEPPLPSDIVIENAEDTGVTQSAVSMENPEQKALADSAEPSHSNIIGAVRARLRQLGKRLPSFKPKVYTVPESTYEPIDDNIKSPSLMADVEEYIRRRNHLGVVELEYDEMRDYIRSVNTEVQLSREDIRLPHNIQEVHAAEDELFDLINQISEQNEQQRRQIGIYAPRPQEDPYNYRGINDARQNYTDIEDSSFSMQPRVNFESEQKIDPNREAIKQQYYHRLHEMEEQKKVFGEDFEDDFDDDLGGTNRYDAFDNDFDDDFDDGFNSLGGQDFSNPSSAEGVYDGFDDEFDDDFDNELDSRRYANDSGRRTYSGSRRRNTGSGSFDEELAEDFDQNFTSPRVSVRDADRKPKRVAVRRRG